jgi:hypothetical protein
VEVLEGAKEKKLTLRQTLGLLKSQTDAKSSLRRNPVASEQVIFLTHCFYSFIAKKPLRPYQFSSLPSILSPNIQNLIYFLKPQACRSKIETLFRGNSLQIV